MSRMQYRELDSHAISHLSEQEKNEMYEMYLHTNKTTAEILKHFKVESKVGGVGQLFKSIVVEGVFCKHCENPMFRNRPSRTDIKIRAEEGTAEKMACMVCSHIEPECRCSFCRDAEAAVGLKELLTTLSNNPPIDFDSLEPDEKILFLEVLGFRGLEVPFFSWAKRPLAMLHRKGAVAIRIDKLTVSNTYFDSKLNQSFLDYSNVPWYPNIKGLTGLPMEIFMSKLSLLVAKDRQLFERVNRRLAYAELKTAAVDACTTYIDSLCTTAGIEVFDRASVARCVKGFLYLAGFHVTCSMASRAVVRYAQETINRYPFAEHLDKTLHYYLPVAQNGKWSVTGTPASSLPLEKVQKLLKVLKVSTKGFLMCKLTADGADYVKSAAAYKDEEILEPDAYSFDLLSKKLIGELNKTLKFFVTKEALGDLKLINELEYSFGVQDLLYKVSDEFFYAVNSQYDRGFSKVRVRGVPDRQDADYDCDTEC